MTRFGISTIPDGKYFYTDRTDSPTSTALADAFHARIMLNGAARGIQVLSVLILIGSGSGCVSLFRCIQYDCPSAVLPSITQLNGDNRLKSDSDRPTARTGIMFWPFGKSLNIVKECDAVVRGRLALRPEPSASNGPTSRVPPGLRTQADALIARLTRELKIDAARLSPDERLESVLTVRLADLPHIRPEIALRTVPDGYLQAFSYDIMATLERFHIAAKMAASVVNPAEATAQRGRVGRHIHGDDSHRISHVLCRDGD